MNIQRQSVLCSVLEIEFPMDDESKRVLRIAFEVKRLTKT